MTTVGISVIILGLICWLGQTLVVFAPRVNIQSAPPLPGKWAGRIQGLALLMGEQWNNGPLLQS